VADREKYERGQSVKLSLSVLSPKLLGELPPQIKVDVVDEAGTSSARRTMLRQETPDNLYTVSFPATDRFGAYRVRLAALSDTVEAQERAYQIIVPRLELELPEVDPGEPAAADAGVERGRPDRGPRALPAC
jgi:hypothetical protein